MKRRTLVLFLALLALAAIYAYTELGGPHSFTQTECFRCHISPVADPAALVGKPITFMCYPCHRSMKTMPSHPVDIMPRHLSVPADLPLRRGMLTCNTCHDLHMEKRTLFGRRTYLLRRPISEMKYFCVACHEENLAQPGHIELVSLAHMSGKYVITSPDSPVDELSAQCIGCHDGTVGKAVYTSLGSGQWPHSVSGDHPIGINYVQASAFNEELAPISEVDRRLRFVEGEIGCETCHDTYSGLPYDLVMSNVGSALCLECHLK